MKHDTNEQILGNGTIMIPSKESWQNAQ